MREKIFRFRVGQKVWVRDRAHVGHTKRASGGYTIVEAKVRERHHHPGRHPFYPNGEGYALDGELWWDCYPGCRVYATRAGALAARMSEWSLNTDHRRIVELIAGLWEEAKR